MAKVLPHSQSVCLRTKRALALLDIQHSQLLRILCSLARVAREILFNCTSVRQTPFAFCFSKDKHLLQYTFHYILSSFYCDNERQKSYTMAQPAVDGIREVWASNLYEELKIIRKLVNKYHYIAMDTEFPGVVARPIGEFRSTNDYRYHLMRCNVNILKLIQLGLTFLDESGQTPGREYTTWQFNFKFNLNEDMFAQDSIDLLTSSGIQFKRHEEEGIDHWLI